MGDGLSKLWVCDTIDTVQFQKIQTYWNLLVHLVLKRIEKPIQKFSSDERIGLHNKTTKRLNEGYLNKRHQNV